ncbi:hypothetical protein KL920_001251 [Ogataea angusta]|nr:hypothetical protein KL920_001251 [Ogataea angusta]
MLSVGFTSSGRRARVPESRADSASNSRPGEAARGRDRRDDFLPEKFTALHGGWLQQICGPRLLASASLCRVRDDPFLCCIAKSATQLRVKQIQKSWLTDLHGTKILKPNSIFFIFHIL